MKYICRPVNPSLKKDDADDDQEDDDERRMMATVPAVCGLEVEPQRSPLFPHGRSREVLAVPRVLVPVPCLEWLSGVRKTTRARRRPTPVRLHPSLDPIHRPGEHKTHTSCRPVRRGRVHHPLHFYGLLPCHLAFNEDPQFLRLQLPRHLRHMRMIYLSSGLVLRKS